MAGNKRKRKNAAQRPGIHPRNKYCDNPPDFGLLASLYPAFQPYVFYSPHGRPRIDWTDFNATRQLTRVLLLHDHALNWWIPDGQLCPTVPNRSNYIHWIQDLLVSEIIPATRDDGDVKGFDIGTGANCIYPLLGATLHGWKFVGSDITDVAIEWANQNVNSNPHISNLIEIRKVVAGNKIVNMEDLRDSYIHSSGDSLVACSYTNTEDNGSLQSSVLTTPSSLNKCYDGLPILVDVVKDGEVFDFCMCNPPFFESMEEAGLNPKTSCGGTPAEMVCSGGEHAFITRIIEDSTKLKHTFRWYTCMVGRKVNLNILLSQLWNVGATVVKTTEFVQGRTSRWGLAWSFVTPLRKMIAPQKIVENNLSFMLEGLQRRHAAFHVLQFVESYLVNGGASCKLDTAAFHVDVTISKDQIGAILNNQTPHKKSRATNSCHELNTSNTISNENGQPDDVLRFRILVFEQIPGTFLVRGTLIDRASSISGVFPSVFRHVEEVVMSRFYGGRAFVDGPSSSLRT